MGQVNIATASSELKLRHAVLLYSSLSPHTSVYATSHPVELLPEGPQILPGGPLNLDELSRFVEAAQAATAYRGFIEPHLLYLAPNTAAWWRPAAPRTVWFSADKPIGTRHGVTAHPPLVFIVHEREWYVFALAKNERPAPNTPLHVAPYFNVWEHGEICTGNVSLPDRPTPDALRTYEAAFFDSRFTHPNHARIVRYEGGGSALWAHLLDHPEITDFPATALLPRKETLEQAITRITAGD
ncbi:PRTRC system protein B [Ralstonia solanacearum]|uniref:PRTRC system protein B n=1 Tax=Ralstonia solanacearum TaxID=305 RepID=UPI000F6156DB|nr:PRTRC system protein B [Ralstonia solanacearum]